MTQIRQQPRKRTCASAEPATIPFGGSYSLKYGHRVVVERMPLVRGKKATIVVYERLELVALQSAFTLGRIYEAEVDTFDETIH